MIDTSVSLLSHDYAHLFLRDVAGRRGLIVVGMGKLSERGFQMLHRFSDICDRLEEGGVNVIFVYQKESARHVLDSTSVFSARYRQKPCLFLDDDGAFFRAPPRPKSLRVVRLDREMTRLETIDIALRDETWDCALRTLFVRVIASSAH